MKVRYPDLHYHITSGDTEQLIDKLNSGVLDFLVIAQEPDTSVYETLEFPKKDIWGLVFPKDDPLAKKDPDVTLSAEKRKIGGLGIYLVKKTMDSMMYERRDGRNIVTMKKKFG